MTKRTILITGATGLIGSHVVEQALARGDRVRALARASSTPERAWLATQPVEIVDGDLRDVPAVKRALAGVTHVVHCAAKVGDWGDPAEYHAVNIVAQRELLDAAGASLTLERFVAISSLGVYEPRDHYGTDETTPPWRDGFDPYTRTKADAELMVHERIATRRFPAVILRPGFVYGARDRHVLPGLIKSLESGIFTYLGDGKLLLDNVYVKNVVAAVMLALEVDEAVGEVFNVTDDPLVTRRQFVGTVARLRGLPEPTRAMPRPVAKALAWTIDRGARLLGAKEPPPLSMARYKFLALNLDYSIAKAKHVLGYAPPYTFETGMQEAMAWFNAVQ